MEIGISGRKDFCKHSRVKYKSGGGLYKKPRKRKYGSR